MMRALSTGVALVAIAAASSAYAGSLSVGPTLVELSGLHRIASVRVQNTGAQQTIVQLETVAWSQNTDGDQYAPSDDLLATPTVFQLMPGESRDVRVGLRSAAPEATEKSFRLYVREVVPTRANAAAAQLSFAIRIGVPVFVHAGRSTTATASLSWATAGNSSECRHLSILNSGGAHVHALNLEYLDGDRVLWHSTTPTYILARTQRLIEPATCLPETVRGDLKLRLTTDRGTAIVPRIAPPS